MNIKKVIVKSVQYLTDPDYRWLKQARKGKYDHWSDEDFIKRMYRAYLKKDVDLKNPKTLNEKLQWLKLHDRNPEYCRLVDKYEVKKHPAALIGEEHIVPTLGVWERFEDIDFAELPDQFVLKCTHDSGGLVICRNKATLDMASARKKIEASLQTNFYYRGREWPYKDVKPRIIAEKFMVDESGVELKDYKIFCFNGEPEYVEVDFNRHIKHKLNPYDFDWNPLNFCDSSKNDYTANIPKPVRLEEMRQVARELSKNSRFLRVDFYSIGEQFYVGELTFYPGSGFIRFDPPETDLKYGQLLRLQG